MLKYWLLLLLIVMVLAPVGAQDEPAPLFREIDTSQAQRSLPAQSPLVGAERVRYMIVDAAALSSTVPLSGAAGTQSPTPLILNLFEDVTLTAIPDRVEARNAARTGGRDGVQWFGHIEGVDGSNVILIITADGRITGRVMTPTDSYYIAPLADGAHSITQIDIVEAHEALEVGVPIPPQVGQIELPPVLADSGDLIDVMVVYTPAAQAILGGMENTLLAIEEMIAMTNQSYANSQIDQRVRLVHVASVTYTEDPSPYTDDLQALTNTNDGKMDEVHSLRNQYAADLVMLLSGTPEAQRNYCGVAWMLNGSAAFGFSVSEAVCVGTVVMPHEFGHNMGAAHDKANGGSGYYSYSYGYQDVKENVADWGDFVTVMAYGRNGQCPPDNPLADVGEAPICPHILQWSDPAQTFGGKALGNAGTNNVLTLNNTAQIVANFRVQVNPPEPPENLSAVLNGAQIDLTWTNLEIYDLIQIERSSNNGFSFSTLASVDGTDTTYTDSALNCSTTYVYRLKAVDGLFDSAYSANAQASSPACVSGAELLVNGGFEAENLTPQQPQGWKLVGGSQRDKVRCDKPEKGKFVAYEGNCAFQFKGESGENTRLSQKPPLEMLEADDTLTLSAVVQTKNTTRGATLRVIVAYEDGTRDKAIFRIYDALGATSAYTLLTLDPLTLRDTTTLVRAQIRYKRKLATGKIFVDDVSLWHTTPAPLGG